MGPHKDIVGMWRDAARARGLRFGMTEHLGATFSWFAVNKGADDTGPYAGVPYDGNDEAFEDLYLPNRENYDAAHKMGAPVPWYTTNKWWHQRWLALVTEMIDMYQPDLLYSDGELPFGEHQYDAGLRAVAHLYNASAARNSGINEAVYNHKGRAENQRALALIFRAWHAT
jgi:alpha-L-fucosidase